MSYFLQSTGGMLGNLFSCIRNDDRVQIVHYSSRWMRFGIDLLWPRPFFVGYSSTFGVSNYDLHNALDVWDWEQFLSADPMVGQRRDTISGITRDSTGAALGSVTVKCFNLSRDLITDTVVSDATTGAFSVTTPYIGETVYLVAYKAGTPVYGATGQLTPS